MPINDDDFLLARPADGSTTNKIKVSTFKSKASSYPTHYLLVNDASYNSKKVQFQNFNNVPDDHWFLIEQGGVSKKVQASTLKSYVGLPGVNPGPGSFTAASNLLFTMPGSGTVYTLARTAPDSTYRIYSLDASNNYSSILGTHGIMPSGWVGYTPTNIAVTDAGYIHVGGGLQGYIARSTNLANFQNVALNGRGGVGFVWGVGNQVMVGWGLDANFSYSTGGTNYATSNKSSRDAGRHTPTNSQGYFLVDRNSQTRLFRTTSISSVSYTTAGPSGYTVGNVATMGDNVWISASSDGSNFKLMNVSVAQQSFTLVPNTSNWSAFSMVHDNPSKLFMAMEHTTGEFVYYIEGMHTDPVNGLASGQGTPGQTLESAVYNSDTNQIVYTVREAPNVLYTVSV
jgi:hypothetical protein